MNMTQTHWKRKSYEFHRCVRKLSGIKSFLTYLLFQEKWCFKSCWCPDDHDELRESSQPCVEWGQKVCTAKCLPSLPFGNIHYTSTVLKNWTESLVITWTELIDAVLNVHLFGCKRLGQMRRDFRSKFVHVPMSNWLIIWLIRRKGWQSVKNPTF